MIKDQSKVKGYLAILCHIPLEVPIFTNYILTHWDINVNTFFSFFGIFISFLYRGCGASFRQIKAGIYKKFSEFILTFVSTLDKLSVEAGLMGVAREPFFGDSPAGLGFAPNFIHCTAGNCFQQLFPAVLVLSMLCMWWRLVLPWQ